MIPFNPGNLLPFYTKRRWQRHRQIGQDRIPFGLTATRHYLLPFQVYVSGAAPVSVAWVMRSAVDDLTYHVLDSDLLTITEMDDASGYWVTWDGGQTIYGADEDVVPHQDVPDCGFWYIELTLDGTTYYSEVLYLSDICGEDAAALEIVPDSCSVDGSDLIFTLQASVFSPAGYTYSLQKFLLGWSEISDEETYEITLVEGNESAELRIQVVTACGATLTVTYDATWTSGDACNTLALSFVSSAIVNGLSVGDNPTWKLKITNTTDKGQVLYQDSYTQWLYLLPVWATPPVERNVEIEVNGDGDEVRRFTRTVERRRFEFADMPDYVLGFLAKAGDHSSVILEEVETGDSVTLSNAVFESRVQGSALNIGILTFDAEAEAFSGCQEDYIID